MKNANEVRHTGEDDESEVVEFTLLITYRPKTTMAEWKQIVDAEVEKIRTGLLGYLERRARK
jgi:hypothetical protein